jgi:hypothetical protein
MTFAFAMLVLALAADPSFEAWKHRHRRTYATMAEEGHRRAVYQANQRLVRGAQRHIAEHNARQSFVTLEMNAFGDLTHREWADGHLRLRRQQPSDGGPNRTASCAAALHAACQAAHDKSLLDCVTCVQAQKGKLTAAGCTYIATTKFCADGGHAPPPPPPPPWPAAPVGPLPETVDWRSRDNRSAVLPPLNQGSCGACYAFAAAAAMESAWAIHSAGHPLRRLSPQQIIDCSRTPPFSNHGCAGGNMANSYAYAVDHGMELDSSYPYLGAAAGNGSCSWREGVIEAIFKGWKQVSGSPDGTGVVVSQPQPPPRLSPNVYKSMHQLEDLHMPEC